ncbi:TPA: hypothetical protein ACTW9I_004714 [Raoultella planticola]
MTTENVETKIYKSLPQPNQDKPITIDTFSYWSIPVARIKFFNGVENSLEIMAVYSHLLGWKKTTGQIRPPQQYIADCCCMGLSTVQKKVKLLVKMGWITATSVRKPGSKEISYTTYTVKDPEVIMAELNTGLSQRGESVVTIAKNQKVKAGESGKDEQKQQQKYEQPTIVASETAAPVAGKPDGVPVVGAPVDDALPIDDNAPLSGPDGKNVVEFSRSGRPKLSFKFVSPDDDDQEETYQGYGGDIEQETYSEPTQADFDAALENL